MWKGTTQAVRRSINCVLRWFIRPFVSTNHWHILAVFFVLRITNHRGLYKLFLYSKAKIESVSYDVSEGFQVSIVDFQYIDILTQFIERLTACVVPFHIHLFFQIVDNFNSVELPCFIFVPFHIRYFSSESNGDFPALINSHCTYLSKLTCTLHFLLHMFLEKFRKFLFILYMHIQPWYPMYYCFNHINSFTVPCDSPVDV
jgi:hypothetical protein